MSKIQKNKDPERWLLRRRNGQGPSEATLETIKRSGSVGPSSGSQSLGPGGRRLKTVDSGMSGLFGDDDDEEGVDRKRRIKKELGAEGDLDELDFEEDFADDEEKMEPDERDDEEAKELEERLKREYKNANKLRDGGVDESEDEEDEVKLSGAGKNLQKTLRKLEKDVAYDESDDEKNPYASSEEEEEEEVPVVQTGPAIIPPEPRNARSASQTPAPNGTRTPTLGQPPLTIKTEQQTQSLSRPTSPIPTSPPGHGGHSLIAKRATSPKVPKPGSPRPGSPLIGSHSTSPPMSRATSPVATSANGSRPGSPVQSPTIPGALGKLTNKRKATEDASSASGAVPGAAPKPKKRKAQGPPGGVELEDRMVIEWLRNTPNATTRDCIHHFTPYLTDEGKKARFTALVKEVAQLSKGVLVLRPAYRDAVSSPAATPSATTAAA